MNRFTRRSVGVDHPLRATDAASEILGDSRPPSLDRHIRASAGVCAKTADKYFGINVEQERKLCRIQRESWFCLWSVFRTVE
jgi:hypothetical protein